MILFTSKFTWQYLEDDTPTDDFDHRLEIQDQLQAEYWRLTK